MEKQKDYSDAIAMTAFTLMGIGVVMVYSSKAGWDSQFTSYRLLLYAFAVLIVFLFSIVPYQWFSIPERGEIKGRIQEADELGSSKFLAFVRGVLRCAALPLFMLATLSLLILIFAGFGKSVNNSMRWIVLGPIKFQPSEMAKYCVIFFLCWFAVKHNHVLQRCSIIKPKNSLDSPYNGPRGLKFFALLFMAFIVPAVYILLVIVNDFGTGAFMCLIAALILFIGGLPLWMLAGGVTAGIPLLSVFVWLRPYRVKRILAFLNDNGQYKDINYQQNQSLAAIYNGGIFGEGLGRGICKRGAVPEAETDFIFSVIGEELGLLGALLVIALFVTLLILGLKTAKQCREPFGKLLAFTISAAFAIQAFMNILVVLKLLPNKGIPLPFISAGGTSLFISCMGIGILMNIARQSSKSLEENY
ncbi:Cell division protein FtsW [Sedimentisphaera cyanobacteriorum]|uniref:Probable peptidoglycan glycosyltransferase FtsW n=1 Tax=Sedimentisphaera cyanobacteriorum TaxID=1940790 RepID=A0A1Q2HSN5_9BACT|nr:FtsW/RodA/SpoVE family cell cycle protein [Sedimentisphaera cyanobacteriorum]AQQ10243.1 Cell division protein FtsW [Sedimentisphaera cyanobacteriorum]